VRFIEYMPFDGNKWSEDRLIPYKDMVAIIHDKYPDFAPIEDHTVNETSKAWKVPGYAGQIGFITSMSDHFCGSCNRLRMMNDGNLKVHTSFPPPPSRPTTTA
jgi:cyclic pyranopterin phosphate synthase